MITRKILFATFVSVILLFLSVKYFESNESIILSNYEVQFSKLEGNINKVSSDADVDTPDTPNPDVPQPDDPDVPDPDKDVPDPNSDKSPHLF